MKTEEPTCLQLTDNYRITRSDDRNLELEEFRTVVAKRGRYVDKKTETDRWVSLGFYGSVPQAVSGVLTSYGNELTQRERMTLEVFLEELKAIKSSLIKSVESSGIKLTDFIKAPDGRGKQKTVKVGKVPTDTSNEKVKSTVTTKKRGRPRKISV